jgi:hypothetical protein
MANRNNSSLLISLSLFVFGLLFITIISSCGKQSGASPTGLNIEYQVLNLSPDLGPVNLFVNFTQVNAIGNPFVFEVNQGYFYVPSIDTPYQFRSALTSGAPLLNRDDILQSGAKYTLFITGSIGNNTLYPIFTVDTDFVPTVGRGTLRFVNASPTATGGLDIYANGTLAFGDIVYKKYSNFTELPAGNYDIKVEATGTTSILNEQPSVTIQDGRLYTLYAYGYNNTTDSATFNAAVITNK